MVDDNLKAYTYVLYDRLAWLPSSDQEVVVKWFLSLYPERSLRRIATSYIAMFKEIKEESVSGDIFRWRKLNVKEAFDFAVKECDKIWYDKSEKESALCSHCHHWRGRI